MKVLFIGGTGNISTSVSRMALERGIDLYLLNRGKRDVILNGANTLIADISDPAAAAAALHGHTWDAVVNWIAFSPADVERDIALFNGKTAQYIFISSASAYQKPLANPIITESTPLDNPYWQYSRDKITCETILTRQYQENYFPMTIVRPSLTFDTVIPVPIGGWTEFTIVDRIRKGKKIIVHGDGSSLWTITHAEDFAKGLLGLLRNPRAIGEAFHITSDEILTWDQIHFALANAAGAEPKIVHIPSDLLVYYNPELLGSLIGDKSVSVVFDNSKIKKFIPNFNATIPFAEGIKRTLAWFEADKKRQIIEPATNDMMDSMISRFERAYSE
jgi:nucleoside-diphosphate-sugar epimerase